MITSGSTMATVIKYGTWTSGRYKCYSGPHSDEAEYRPIALLETANSDIGDIEPGKHSIRPKLSAQIPKVRDAISQRPTPIPTKQGASVDSSVISETADTSPSGAN